MTADKKKDVPPPARALRKELFTDELIDELVRHRTVRVGAEDTSTSLDDRPAATAPPKTRNTRAAKPARPSRPPTKN
jgi:hypothetical protein